MLRVMASDGVDVAAVDEGSGPCVVIVHGGLGDPQAWGKVAERLRDRFRVVRLHRRRYRLDLDLANCAMTDEARDVRAVAEEIGRPFVLYSDGEFDGPASRSRAQLDAGHTVRAIGGFLRDFVQVPVLLLTGDRQRLSTRPRGSRDLRFR